jgi:hypothetical protein
MRISRRQAIHASGTTLASLALGLRPEHLLAQAQQTSQPVPDKLVDSPLRDISPLPLLPDGSAPEHTLQEVGTISDPAMWRYSQGQAPQIEFDYRKMKIKVDTGRVAKRSGTLTFATRL